MTVDWIEAIYDRTNIDVLEVESNPSLENAVGCYNASDLNRIENNTRYVMESMLEKEIIRAAPSLAIKTNWINTEIPTREDMDRIIGNVMKLMELSNPIIFEDLKVIYSGTQMNFILANSIEYNLELMKNQPELPVQRWLLTVENGIIVEYQSSSAEIAEDEVVHIEGVPYGEYAEYMTFLHWSGDANDLQYVGETTQQNTTFTMVYHDSETYSVKLTANFVTRIPRKLTLNGGVIVETESTTGTYYAGDEILIRADLAADGKRFYEWQGTEAALENITGGTEPSTSWLTMPDCDVTLTSFYINAGKHAVYIDNSLYDWYDYKEYVFLSPESRGEKWSFAYWSGDTGYLEDVTSSSFEMPDVNVYFYSNWTYNYSYNTVTMIGGKINGLTKGENLREGSGQTIVADTAPEGYVFDKWIIEGVGGFNSEEDVEKATSTFYVGDGNAILTATYVKAHIVTIENAGNTGETTSVLVGEGKKYTIDSTEVLADYMFDYWNKDDALFNSYHRVENIVMGTEDVRYTAVYRNRNYYTLTVVSGSGSGTYKERQDVTITANTPGALEAFNSWSGNYYSINNKYATSTTITMPSEDCTVTAMYDGRIYHNVTVNNGSGTGTYYEGQTVTCRGDQAPDGWEFSHWLEGETIVSYANPYRFEMGTSDRELTAVYKEIPYFTLTVINGTGSGTFIRNSQPRIAMDPAPEGYQFLIWEVLEGDSNDVYQPQSENTYIRNLVHNVTVKATYHIPNPEIKYTLTVKGKDGQVTTYNYPAGEEVNLYADAPDDGYYFYKWTGDNKYLYDKYAEKTVLIMPAQDIELEMEYREEGYVTKYHVYIEGGQVRTEYNEETEEERWDIQGEFEEREVVPIRATNIDAGWEFTGWVGTDDTGKSITTVADILDDTTTVTVEDFDIELSAGIAKKDEHVLTVYDGETSGSYYEGYGVAIYFKLKDTETTKYEFNRWSGDDIAYLKLIDGGSFDIFKSGSTSDDAQIISMPNRNITIRALYDTYHRLKLSNGTIGDTGLTEEFYKQDEQILIHADEIEGLTFSHWSGDTKYLSNRRIPNPIVTMPAGSINLKAEYVNKNNRNDIACVDTYLYDITNVTTDEVTVVSGDLIIGALVLDNVGHHYVVTNIEGDTLTIFRLTQKGGTTNG